MGYRESTTKVRPNAAGPSANSLKCLRRKLNTSHRGGEGRRQIISHCGYLVKVTPVKLSSTPEIRATPETRCESFVTFKGSENRKMSLKKGKARVTETRKPKGQVPFTDQHQTRYRFQGKYSHSARPLEGSA